MATALLLTHTKLRVQTAGMFDPSALMLAKSLPQPMLSLSIRSVLSDPYAVPRSRLQKANTQLHLFHPERLLAPAIRLHNGAVITGKRSHLDAVKSAVKRGHSREALQQVMEQEGSEHLPEYNPHVGTGFATSHGRWVNRFQAMRLAEHNGQLDHSALARHMEQVPRNRQGRLGAVSEAIKFDGT